MPLRGFLYFAAEYAGWLARHKKDVHSKGLVKIPSPSYYVLYNGTNRNVETVNLRLSDAFEKPAEGRKADARNMLADGMPMEKIIQYTSLPLEEVENLAAAETEPVLA